MQNTLQFRILLPSDFDAEFYGRLSGTLAFLADHLTDVPVGPERITLSFMQRSCTAPDHYAAVGGDSRYRCAVHGLAPLTDNLLGSALLIGFLVWLSKKEPDMKVVILGGAYLTVPAVVLQAGTFSLDEATVAKVRADLEAKGSTELLGELDQAIRRFEAGEHVVPLTVREAVPEGKVEGIEITPDMLDKPLGCLFQGITM